jgi:hypothetical protein
MARIYPEDYPIMERINAQARSVSLKITMWYAGLFG